MPFYRVQLEGGGIQIPDVEGGAPITGFFTTRAVREASPELAVERAKALVQSEWAKGAYREANVGEPPSLAASEVWRDHLWGYLTFRASGYVFFTNED